VQAINTAFNRALSQDAVKNRLSDLTMDVTTNSTPESAARFLAAEMAKWEPIIRTAGIKPN
jgi:tripartite-type tricarboxylate transporter receptor subunit TctC